MGIHHAEYDTGQGAASSVPRDLLVVKSGFSEHLKNTVFGHINVVLREIREGCMCCFYGGTLYKPHVFEAVWH